MVAKVLWGWFFVFFSPKPPLWVVFLLPEPSRWAFPHGEPPFSAKGGTFTWFSHPELPRLSVTRSSANKCLLKVATYAAQLEQYQKAVEIYEQVGAVLPSSCAPPAVKGGPRPQIIRWGGTTGRSSRPSVVFSRWAPAPWTVPCSSTAPRSTSSRPPSATSASTCSTPRLGGRGGGAGGAAATRGVGQGLAGGLACSPG